MTVYLGETQTYQDACNLIKKLLAIGIDASIAEGGVSIACKPEQINLAQEICKKLGVGVSFRTGYTSSCQELLIKSPDGRFLVEKVQGDAKAVVSEWKK